MYHLTTSNGKPTIFSSSAGCFNLVNSIFWEVRGGDVSQPACVAEICCFCHICPSRRSLSLQQGELSLTRRELPARGTGMEKGKRRLRWEEARRCARASLQELRRLGRRGLILVKWSCECLGKEKLQPSPLQQPPKESRSAQNQERALR